MADAGVILGEAEVQADRFGVADMEVAVRFRRETRDDLAAMFSARIVGINDLSNEVGNDPDSSLPTGVALLADTAPLIGAPWSRNSFEIGQCRIVRSQHCNDALLYRRTRVHQRSGKSHCATPAPMRFLRIGKLPTSIVDN